MVIFFRILELITIFVFFKIGTDWNHNISMYISSHVHILKGIYYYVHTYIYICVYTILTLNIFANCSLTPTSNLQASKLTIILIPIPLPVYVIVSNGPIAMKYGLQPSWVQFGFTQYDISQPLWLMLYYNYSWAACFFRSIYINISSRKS